MAEATGLRNNALPYPIYAQPFGVVFPLLDADGDPISPSSPDSEYSLNGDTFGDCSNEAVEIAASSGICYLLLTAAEMTADVVAVRIQSTGAKTTVIVLYPRKLVTLRAGTAAGGAAGSITLDGGASAVDDFYNGCVVAGVLDSTNEVRIITDYNGTTKVASVTPNWNTTPDSDDTFTILLPEGRQINQANVTHVAETAQTARDIGASVLLSSGTGTGQLDFTSGIVKSNLSQIGGVAQSATDLKDFADTGYDPAAHKVQGVVLTDTLTTYTGNTPQTGDVFPLASTEIADIKAKTDNLPSDPADASDIAAAFSAVNSALTTIDDFLDTEIAAIKAKTDQLTFSTANRVDSQVFGMEAGTVTAAAIATDAIDADALAADAVDEIWDETVGTNLTARYALNLLASGGLGSFAVNDAGASTTAFITTLTSAVDDFYRDMQLTFTSGALAGQTRIVSGYAQATKTVTLDEALTSAPANGVTFVLTGPHTHTVTSIADGVWASATRTLTALPTIPTNWITADGIATDAFGSLELAAGAAAEIAAAVLTTQMTESYNADGAAPTLAEALFVCMQRLTDFSISGTTISIKKLDGSTEALTLTIDSATTPTSSTRAT